MFVQFKRTVAARRMTGATAASVLFHLVLVALVAFLLARDGAPAGIVEPPQTPSRLVFLQSVGPGGGGGGSPTPAPSRPIEIPETTPPTPAPVEVPPVVVPPLPPRLTIPVMTPDAISLQASGSTSVSLVAPGGGGGQGAGAGAGSGDGVGDGSGGNFGGGLARPGAGVEGPVLVRDREPAYTSEALRARIQGQVELQAIVLDDGTVGDVKVVKSLDKTYGLDLEAIKAARQWRFLPARQNGKPVPILVTMLLDFRIN